MQPRDARGTLCQGLLGTGASGCRCLDLKIVSCLLCMPGENGCCFCISFCGDEWCPVKIIIFEALLGISTVGLGRLEFLTKLHEIGLSGRLQES